MDTNSRNRLTSARKRLLDLEQRIGPYMPKPVVKNGFKRGEWHSGYDPPPSAKPGGRGNAKKTAE